MARAGLRPIRRAAVIIAGASGVVLGLVLSHELRKHVDELYAVVTERALEIAELECGSREEFLSMLRRCVDEVYMGSDWSSPLASSSRLLDACVAAPASMRLIAAVAEGVYTDLASRVLGNCLRLRRPTAIAFREAPLGPIELEKLYRLSIYGACIVPMVIAPYANAIELRSVLRFVAGKLLDCLGIESDLYERWEGARIARSRDLCRGLVD